MEGSSRGGDARETVASSEIYDELLRGAVDLHCHVDFEFCRKRMRKIEPEWRWLPAAEAAGIRAVVLKSHWWPTAATVHYLEQLYKGPVEVIPSVTLNHSAGGAALYTVESAAAMGCQVVYLPTWSARGDVEAQGMSRRLEDVYATFRASSYEPISFEEGGRLSASGHELLRYCQEQGLTLATGHVSWRETMLFAAVAAEIGFERLVFNHPLSDSVSAPLDAVVEAARSGCWIEFPWTLIAPGRLSGAEAANLARRVGLGRVVATTDFFRSSSPPPPLLLRSWLGELHDGGLPVQAIRLIAAQNPARALGWEE